MQNVVPLIPWVLLLASCSSPPKPPTVDESQKRPVNSQMAVELQVCRNDLQNTRILAAESGRLAEIDDGHARQPGRAAADHRGDAGAGGQAAAAGEQRLHGALRLREHTGSPYRPTSRRRWSTDAKAAPLVLLRGRTDGSSDAPVESRIARERAAAVRDYLVAAGVDPARIRATYQPAGDHVADNSSARRPRPEPPRRDRGVPRAARRHVGHAARGPALSRCPTPHPREVAMDADNSPVRLPAPTQGGTVEPANRATVAKERFQTPVDTAWRALRAARSLRRSDVPGQQPARTWRPRPISWAARRFVAVAEDGKRTTIAEGRRRVAARAAAPGAARAPARPRAPSATRCPRPPRVVAMPRHRQVHVALGR